jgi:hypothetical protein
LRLVAHDGVEAGAVAVADRDGGVQAQPREFAECHQHAAPEVRGVDVDLDAERGLVSAAADENDRVLHGMAEPVRGQAGQFGDVGALFGYLVGIEGDAGVDGGGAHEVLPPVACCWWACESRGRVRRPRQMRESDLLALANERMAPPRFLVVPPVPFDAVNTALMDSRCSPG